jgi:tRNA pseudouridine38-40 synthase
VRFKLTIEYAGMRYSGWQIQKNARTVQGALEDAVHEAVGSRDFELYGSGRTDAGVHALGQVAHLDVHTQLPPETLRRRLNDALPTDIVLLRVERVRHRFHARHDAVARSYLYQVARRRTAFAKPFVWWVKEDLSLERMSEAARTFVGLHDFHAFSDDDPGEKSTKVQIDRFEIREDEDLLLFHIEGSHFIWKMVRRLVGVIVEVGRGGIPPSAVAELLANGGREIARLTAPASGLFLERVYYPGDRRNESVRPTVALRKA